ncbi:hypothetical protein AN476_15840 [Phaeobacter sp. 11ANDIMAR09]|nr:hypothetical protein AN476_15840 [Phaeobacter sp. 11ANDIMAR09]
MPRDETTSLPDWARRERPMASMLPYVSLVDDVTVRTRGNELFQCIRLVIAEVLFVLYFDEKLGDQGPRIRIKRKCGGSAPGGNRICA